LGILKKTILIVSLTTFLNAGKIEYIHINPYTNNFDGTLSTNPLDMDSNNIINVSTITFTDGTIMFSTSTLGGGGAGDNLGNHTATQDINFNNYGGINISTMTFSPYTEVWKLYVESGSEQFYLHNDTGGDIISITKDGIFNFWKECRMYTKLRMQSDKYLTFGSGDNSHLIYSTSDDNNLLKLGISSDSNSFLICESEDTGFNFAHSVQTNPTLFIHSENQATDEWISLSHDSTDGIINVGKGKVKIDDDLTVTGTGTFDSITETNPTLLKLDQTSVQTITNDIPLLNSTLSGTADLKSVVNKEYVDLVVTSLGAAYYMYDEDDATGYKTCYLNPSSDAEEYIEGADLSDGDYIGGWISASDESPTKLLKGVFDWYITLEKTSGTKDLRVYWTLIERKSDTSEVVISTSSNSNVITDKESYLVPLQLDEDYIPDSGSRIVGKLYADISGGGSAPTVRLYYQGNTSSRWEIPANTEIFQNIFIPYEGAVKDVDLGSKNLTTTGTIEGATLTEGGVDVPNVNDNLGVFSPTTSSQLAAVITDEKGSTGYFILANDTPAKNDVIMFNGTDFVFVPEGTTFTFSCTGFSDGESTTQLIGSGVWRAQSAMNYTASYENEPPTSADVLMSINGASYSQVGEMTSPSYTTGTNTQDINYPNTKDKYLRFRLDSTDGTDSDIDYDSAIWFRNKIFWGVVTKSSGLTEADIEGLNSQITNDFTQNKSISAGAGEYIVWAYPTSYTAMDEGDDYEDDGGTDFKFKGIALAMIRDNDNLSITNSAGYTEGYDVYVSKLANLGSSTLYAQTTDQTINPLYYGKTTKTSGYNESDIEGLEKSEITNDNTQVWDPITTGEGEYMLFAFPKRLGTVTFWVGGFEGGFEDPETVSVTNSNGWTEDYYAWRSENANLGETEVETK